MPIETITKNGRRRYRWTFDRVIEGERIRKANYPCGTCCGRSGQAQAELGRRGLCGEFWHPALYRDDRPWILLRFEDKSDGWKDVKTPAQVIEKYAPKYEDQDALNLYEWSVRFATNLRSTIDCDGKASDPCRPVRSTTRWATCAPPSSMLINRQVGIRPDSKDGDP